MPVMHGRKANLKVADTGGTLRDLSSVLKDIDFPRDRDLADTSTLGTDDRQNITGMRGATISANGLHEPTTDGYLDGIFQAGDPVNFEYYPQGNASGRVKLTGQVLCNSYGVSTGTGDAGTFSLGLTVNGAVTRALVP